MLITTDVLIVGAGPTGLALALTLKHAGVDCLLVEKRLDIQNTSRAAVVHAHTLDVLDRIGAAESLAAAGLRLRKFSIRDRGHALVRLDFANAPSKHAYVLMLPQDQTEKLLGEALEKAGGSIQRGEELVGLEQTTDGVLAELRSTDGERKVRARYVVGADGMHSLVRDKAGIAFGGAAYGESLVLADVKVEWQQAGDDVMLFFSPEGMVVVAPLPDGRFRIVATCDNAPDKPDAALIERILRERGPHGPVRVTSVGWSSRFRVHHRLAEHYRQGRILLMGDAAHVHSPAGGQGMNTGLVDAVVLGEVLAAVISGRKDEHYLDEYERLRRPAAEQVLDLAGRLTALATMRGALQRWIRNLGLRVLFRVPAMRRTLLMGLSGLGRADRAKLPQ